jgi:hypothetical protein
MDYTADFHRLSDKKPAEAGSLWTTTDKQLP